MEILAQSSLLVALTSFAFGFSTLARNVRNKLYILFAITCILISGWALFFFLSTLYPESGYYGWHLSLNAWITPAALLFIQYMMRIEKWAVSRTLFGVSFGLCVIMSVALILGLERHDWIRSVIYYTPTLILIQTVLLIAVDKRIDPLVGVSRRLYLYAGVLLVLLTSVMDHVPGLWMGIPIFGNLALTAFLYLLSQALLQQRLLHFSSLFTRFLTLAVIAFLLTSIYSLVAVWAKDFGLFFLNSFIVSFLLLSVLDPIRTLVLHITEGLFSKKRKSLHLAMKAVQSELSQSMEPAEAVEVFLAFLVNTLRPRGIAAYLEAKDLSGFKRIKAEGDPDWLAKSPLQISQAHSVIDALTHAAFPALPTILLSDLLEVQFQRMAGREKRERLRQWIDGIENLRGNLAIPLSVYGEVFGVVILDLPNPPEEWGGNWSILNLIQPLVTRVSETIKKTETYASRRERERLATIGEMAAGLAHEIRNPLGAIKGAAQYLNPTDGKPESRFLRVIIEEVDRLNRVVTQFLDYSKPDAEMVRQKVDLNQVAQNVVTLLSNAAPFGVDLNFETTMLEAQVQGSSEPLRQVLLNLIQNSFKSLAKTNTAIKEVLVSIQESQDHTKVILSVEDNGRGISTENLNKIFIPFFTTDPQGTGLGLPISQKIIQGLGGRLEVDSTPLQKTEFRIVLPKWSEGGQS